MTQNNDAEQDIVEKLQTRARIRRHIQTRKSVQEGKPDRIADLCDEAAAEIEALRKKLEFYMETFDKEF